MENIYILLLRDRIVIDEHVKVIKLLEANNISYRYNDDDLIIKGYENIYKALYYITDAFNIILN